MVKMFAKAQKWGNSLAVRLPKTVAKECGISAETSLEIIKEDNCIIIKPVQKQRYSLDDLLEKVTAENMHSEVSTGEAVGKEMW